MKLQIVKALFLLVLVSLFSALPAQAALPKDYQEFKARYQQMGTTPEGAVKMYFDAVFCYMDTSKRDEAIKMLRYALHANANWERSPNYSTFVSRMKNTGDQHIFRSFAKGTSPANSYSMSPDNYELEITGKRQESDYMQVYVRSTGADSPRPLWVQQFDGLWYTTNNAGSYSGVRPPAKQTQKNANAHDADFD